ncbi:hypothetical protein MKD41_10155 [Lutibacter sp. A64]|uniref:hypothetical protein n=1 Tax=Lutibacter sp. A64 TaxID=2918526 RepID=UPI001F051006|nr:hypothetical protein [Lutibacter sp. A64]UMB52698.1 hypothetical protein MKD41_10155 [Lutibacter sp. A64]
MKKLSIILALFIVTISCKGNENKPADSLSISTDQQDPKLKRYEVKSGIINYKLTTNGKIMGSTTTGSGTENLYFKDWGNIELVEEKSTTKTVTKIFGKTNTDVANVHAINKLNNGESYHVDFDKKQIYLRRDMAMEMTKTFAGGDVNKTGMQMLESMGGKKIGTESFLGYNCEIWDVMGAKQWMYKGAVLKLEMTVMGIVTIKEATSAKFNVNVSDSHFKLPDFPIIKEEGFMDNDEYQDEMEDMDEKMDMLSKMSFEEWKKISLADKSDEEMQNMSEEELRKTYDMIQKMIKMRQGK